MKTEGGAPSMTDLIEDAVAVGMSPAEVIEEYQFNPKSVRPLHWRARNKDRFRVKHREYQRRCRAQMPRMPQSSHKWTGEEMSYLIDLREEGLSMSQVGEELGRTRDEVAGMMFRLRERGIHVD